MKIQRLVLTAGLVSLLPATARSMTILISGAEQGNDEIEAFITANFIPAPATSFNFIKGQFGNFNANAATINSADFVIIGRNLNSGDYQGGVAAGYNSLTVPVVSFTSYVARDLGTRMGWHDQSATNNTPVAGEETTITPAGAAFFGISEGTADFFAGNINGNFNGLPNPGANVGDGTVLTTIGGRVHSAYWMAGDAPGVPSVAGVDTFAGPRLLFNLDDSSTPRFTFAFLTPAGEAALVGGLVQMGLTPIPEPSTALLGLFAAGACALRRRRG